MKKILLLIAVLAGLSFSAQAQDPMYTNAFLSPVYLNPAATGMSDYDLRLSAVYRRQWLVVPSGMQYFTVSADKYMFSQNIGVGLMVNSEREGYINKLGVHGTFAKLLCFGTHQLNLGLQAGLYNRRIDYSKLWFADQINNQGIVTNLPSQVSPGINNKKWVPDFAAGVMWVHNSGLMVGASVHHLNQPDESFTNQEESKLPRRLTVNSRFILGTNLALWDEPVDVVPGIIYSRQRNNQLFSLGAEAKSHYINFGLWYRMNMNIKRSDAFCVTVILHNFLGSNNEDNTNNVRGGFGYDATTTPGFTRTAGSSEGALVWEHLHNEDARYDNRCNSIIRNGIICPPSKIF
jgi:type IX secretion system PorP/SprF family membrane protein